MSASMPTPRSSLETGGVLEPVDCDRDLTGVALLHRVRRLRARAGNDDGGDRRGCCDAHACEQSTAAVGGLRGAIGDVLAEAWSRAVSKSSSWVVIASPRREQGARSRECDARGGSGPGHCRG